MSSFSEYVEVLNEMPKLIGHWSPVELEDKNSNKEFYLEMKRDRHKKLIFKINEHASMYKSGGNYFCLDDKIQQITYNMIYKVDNKKQLGGQYVWQSAVWASPDELYLDGIPAKMLFEYLLPVFKTIVTDSEQSFDGKRFWEKCISKAFAKELNIYFFDFQTKELIEMKSPEHWKDFKQTSNIWGETNKHLMKRMVISSKVI
jgi:hypothetical protein